MKEIGKLKCLPLLRALLLMGKQAILTDFVILYYVHLYEWSTPVLVLHVQL